MAFRWNRCKQNAKSKPIYSAQCHPKSKANKTKQKTENPFELNLFIYLFICFVLFEINPNHNNDNKCHFPFFIQFSRCM